MSDDPRDPTPDLRRLWDDVPVGPVPLEAVRQAAGHDRAPGNRTRSDVRRLRRTLAVVGVAAAVGTAFLVGTQVQPGGGGGGAPGAAGDVAPVAFHGELQAAADCDELVASYVDRALAMVGPYGWESSSSAASLVDDRAFATDSLSADLPRANLATADRDTQTEASPRTESSTSSATGTNVQEAGVDEPDVVKTDGRTLVRLKDDRLTTYDVSGRSIQQVGRLDLDDFAHGEILLTGSTVVAIGDDGTPAASEVAASAAGRPPMTRVLTIDLTDPAVPALTHTVDYDTALLTARQHGDTVRLAVSSGLPDLDFVSPGGFRSEDDAQEENERLVRTSTAADWLPRFRVDGGKTAPFLDCSDVAIPRAGLALDTTAVVGFDAADPAAVQGLGLAGAAPLVYASTDHLYLAASGASDRGFCLDFCDLVRVGVGGDDAARSEDLGTSYVYDFALTDGGGATYVGAGEVEGAIADRWSMDERDGVLRVVVGPSNQTGDFNSVVLLRPRTVGRGAGAETELGELGRLDGIGAGEDVEAVRWFDDLALVVTFRQVDPLHAVDLSDPEAPRQLGELELPGFSDYLHPLGERRVLGLGEGPGPDGATGAQAGLFDVTDLASPTRIDVTDYGAGTRALAGADPRQFTWLPERRTALTVVEQPRTRTGYVSVLGLGGGTLANEMVQVEYGDDVAQVRLVPLPSGRVALVTGESVRFFPVDRPAVEP